ncbi:hypothetical protein [Caldinitratiruptor microaerophilus]|uniref:Uncharacterized protein n=1 Tax=Caldinitratiruptor microaerophilus TaxID=671077 RepID=A0AA35G6U1_9FIRM|nr:hypothetical protein [Caldinitratiruptor microaerophilus]BDG59376.1 hypothetical protein caldi_04660 [Caldinitratiruptor microaerophilus]
MRGRFWFGFAAGWLAALLLVAALVYRLSARGLVLTVDAASVGARVEGEVRAEVEHELPAAIQRARRELPGYVAARVTERLAGGRVQLGAVEIEVPPGLRREIERRLTAELTAAGDELLARVDVRAVAAQAGRVARRLVEERLLGDLQGYRLVLRPVPWLAVPVTVRARA